MSALGGSSARYSDGRSSLETLPATHLHRLEWIVSQPACAYGRLMSPKLPVLILTACCVLAVTASAQSKTERTTFTDGKGRSSGSATTQTTGSTERTTTRDASGRTTGTAVTHQSSSGSERTTFTDGKGRSAGSATTQTSGGTERTTTRDASGRTTGTATKRR